MNNKFTANSGAASSSNITLENNLYIDGEIGIGIGGNKEDPFRFKNITIKNNVFTEIGRSQPTNRTLGWSIDTTDWDGGIVEGNLMIHNTNPNVANTYGINIQGALKNVTMKNNITYNINGYGLVVQNRNADLRENIKISDNIFQETIAEKTILSVSDLTGFTFNNNQYLTQVREDRQVKIIDTYGSFDTWRTNHEETAVFSEYTFPDVTRSIETYNTLINASATIDAFIESCRNQSRFNWDENYTAPVVNNWLRAGFIE